jgi:AcrR family transcriptional regulator
MSLYRHVKTKEELLLILAGRALEELELPKAGTLPWQEEIAEVFRSLHRMLLAHPEFAVLTASQPIDTLVAQRGIEMVLATLQREGLDDEEAVTAYDALVSFARGFNQRHAGRPFEPTQRLSAVRDLNGEEFPHIVKLAGPLVTRDPDKHFDDGLALVIRGIEAQIKAKG